MLTHCGVVDWERVVARDLHASTEHVLYTLSLYNWCTTHLTQWVWFNWYFCDTNCCLHNHCAVSPQCLCNYFVQKNSPLYPNGCAKFFINKCIDDIVPTVTIRTYTNQESWITGHIRTELKVRAAAFKERHSHPEAYKKSRYALWRTIKQAKHQYRSKIESYYTGSDARRMWHTCKLLQTTKGSTTASCPVTQAYQIS